MKIKTILYYILVAMLLLCNVGCTSDSSSQTERSEVFEFCWDNSEKNADIDNSQVLQDYSFISNNQYLRLYLNEENASIAIEDIRSGKVWSSVPTNLENDVIATDDMKNIMNSVLEITYYKENTLENLYSYTDCIARGGLQVEKKENGVSLTFSFGDNSYTYDDFPKLINDSRFKKFFLDNEALEDSELTRVKKYFSYDKEKEAWVLAEETPAMVRNFPKIMEKVGYTKEDLKKDCEEFDIIYHPSSQPYFEIVVDYMLQHDSLIVDVPLSSFQYNQDYPPVVFDLNPYFLHSNGTTDGYMLMPDGSGALVDFSQGGSDTGSCSLKLYGNEQTISNSERAVLEIQSVMPVFGIREGTEGVLAIMEEGDTMASITAMKAGTQNSYNSISASYTLTNRANASIGDGSVSTSVPVAQKEIYQNEIRTRYVFLNENSTYSDMASCMKAYIMQRDQLTLSDLSSGPELNLEVIGAVSCTCEFMGFQYEGDKILTTFDEANEILELYHDAGLKKVNLIYTGALKGGMDNYSLKGNQLLHSLGGTKGWNELQDSVNNQDGTLYLKCKALTVPKESGNFAKNRHSARTLDQSIAKIYDYNLVTDRKESFSNIVSENYLEEYLTGFLSDMTSEGVKAVAFSDLGSKLYADYNSEKIVLRQEAKTKNIDLIQNISSPDVELLLDNPIMDTMTLADDLTNIPLYSNSHKMYSRSVPFLELVVSGLVSYSGEAYNEVDDQRYLRLKMMETGSVPYFVVFYEDNTELRNSDYTYLSSANYNLCFEDSVELAKAYGELVDKVGDSYLQKHECVQKDVYRSTYANGWSVITNYSETDVVVDGATVAAFDYILVEEG